MTPRLVVPDVARGLALLGIALANAPTGWFKDPFPEPADFFGGAHTPLDKATVLFTAVTTHVRGLPMFSTLLGFGIGLIVMSLWRREFPVARARMVVIRRYGFLALFGAIHGLFLFNGDIMFYYGIVGIVLGLMFTLSNKALMIIAWVLLVLGQIIGLGFAALSFHSLTSWSEALPATYGDLLLANLGEFAFKLVYFPIFLIEYGFVFIIGFVWARRGTLANVEENRRTLVFWAVLGGAVALGCGLPWGLSALGIISPSLESGLMMVNNSVGLLCGPGILAALALLLNKVQQRVWDGAALSLWLAVPAALGKRSMSGYLFQSFCFAVISYPFFLGLDLDAFSMSMVATGIWALSLALAWLLERRGQPGPFEWLHRRVSYGPSGRAELSPPSRRPQRPEAT